MSFWSIWRHPHFNTGITFGAGDQNAIKTINFYPRYLSLKFLCDQIIKIVGLILG